MYEIPPVEGVDADTEHVYQGVGIRNLEQAVLQGWRPVEAKEKVGRNWPEGPQGYRMFQEQVLCRMPRERWNELAQEIEHMKEILSVEEIERQYREEVGEEFAYGEIKDG
jgi:hypothetical protein